MHERHRPADRSSGRANGWSSPRLPEAINPALWLQRNAGNRATVDLIKRLQPTATLPIQRLHWAFGDRLPLPDPNDRNEIEKQGGESQWQQKELQKKGADLTETMLGILQHPDVHAAAIVQNLRTREAAKGEKLKIQAGAQDPTTGGDLDWNKPWSITINSDHRLQYSIGTVAHEIKHNEQWYVRFGKGQVSGQPADKPKLDPVEMASLEIPAKKTGAEVAGNVASALDPSHVNEDANQKRSKALEKMQAGAKNTSEAASMSNERQYFDAPDTFRWRFFYAYLDRYASDRYGTEAKLMWAFRTLVNTDLSFDTPLNKLNERVTTWNAAAHGGKTFRDLVLQERQRVRHQLQDTALQYGDWFEAERKNASKVPPRPNTDAMMAELDASVQKILSLMFQQPPPAETAENAPSTETSGEPRTVYAQASEAFSQALKGTDDNVLSDSLGRLVAAWKLLAADYRREHEGELLHLLDT
jgi:hypothetical protein